MSDLWSQWAAGVLAGVGGAVDEINVDTAWAWSGAESLPRDRWSICNPLDATEPAAGAVAFNTLPSGGHVWVYPDVATSVSATVITLLNGRYPTIVDHLRRSVPRGAWGDCCGELGVWGTGCAWLNRDYGTPDFTGVYSMNWNLAAKEFAIQLCWLTTTGHTAPTQAILDNGDGKGRPGANQVANDGSNLNVIIAQFAGVDTGPAYLAELQKAVAAAGAPAGPAVDQEARDSAAAALQLAQKIETAVQAAASTLSVA